MTLLLDPAVVTRPAENGKMLSGALPRISAVGTAVPPNSYSQEELLDIFEIDDQRIRSVFLNGAISRRHLTLPPVGPDGSRRIESQGELLRKHTETGLDMGSRAVLECVRNAGMTLADVRYLCCVTTTGFLTPGFSARLIRELDLRPDTSRLDVVGMGCNAGLNALTAVSGWASTHPGQLAVLVCIEACSAAYVFDKTMRTAVVNSLFGDGASAAAVIAAKDDPSTTGGVGGPVMVEGPQVLGFSSRIITEALGAMRYDWDDDQGKFSFFLDRDVPYVVGAHAEEAVETLLAGSGLRRRDIAHWVVHSGGKKVIDSVRVNLGLTRHDVRHTTGVLRDYGNLSSGSFLFSYERLIAENVVCPGDLAIMMTMGPGSTIELALLQW